jgi:hypothetical protein
MQQSNLQYLQGSKNFAFMKGVRQKHCRCNDGPINLRPIAVFTGVVIMNINLGNLMENVQRTPELTYASDADFPVLSLATFPFYGHIHHAIIMVYSVFSVLVIYWRPGT